MLDLNLPDLHGLEILKRIKGSSPRCVVIILSNRDLPELRRGTPIARVDIGMELARETTIRSFDVLERRRAIHAKQNVQIHDHR